MGIEQSTYKGHRSKHGSILHDETVDYKDPRFMKRAKNELYDLFQQDKIVHREVIMDLDKEIESMEKELKALASENKHLKEQLQKYQELNRVNKESTSSKSIQPPSGIEKPIKDTKPNKKEDDTSSEEESDDENKKELKDKLKNLARKIKQIKKLRESRSRKEKDKTETRLSLEDDSESDESDESD